MWQVEIKVQRFAALENISVLRGWLAMFDEIGAN
jgi:hypothetical protein